MYTFIIIFNSAENIEYVNLFPENMKSFVRKEDDGRLILENKNDWIAINEVPYLLNDYDEKELEFIRSQGFVKPVFLLVEGKGEDFVNYFVTNINNSLNLLIDNDHGVVRSIKEIKSLIETGYNWIIK